MSESMQPSRPSRSTRAERVTTSCSECRRRKQRCNQGHPCSNCARRFPQPPCEYREKTPSGGRIPNISSFPILVRDPAAGVTEIRGLQVPLLPLPPLPSSRTPDQDQGGSLVSWSGIELTLYPDSGDPNKPNASQWTSLRHREIPNCGADCTIHSESFHDAVKLLIHANGIASRYILSPLEAEHAPHDVFWKHGVEAIPNPYGLATPMQLLQSLPLKPTALNADLLQIHVKLLSRFKPALDGNPDYNGPYHRQYIPFCIQSPLLAHVAMYTSACYLNETKNIDDSVTTLMKGEVIRMVNDLLRSDAATSDEAITGVAQLITNEWYWGDTHDLQAHLRGMKKMIQLRGGFRNLGMNGLLSKMVILMDFCIAVTYEMSPYLQPGVEFDFVDSNPGPFKIAHSTPLVSPMVLFGGCTEVLGLHPLAASMLDDIRFLIATIVGLPDDESDKAATKKLHETARWIHERIASYPVDAPETPPKHTPAPSPMPPASQRRPSISPAVSQASSHSVAEEGSSVTTATASASVATSVGNSSQEEEGASTSLLAQSGQGSQDPLYQTIRLTALAYTTAIVSRQPFSESCSSNDFYKIWTTLWRISLTTWKSMLGIFLWIMIAIVPTSRDMVHGRFVKSMLTISALNMGLENWSASNNALRGSMRLQAWLGGGKGKGKGTRKESTTAGSTGAALKDEEDAGML